MHNLLTVKETAKYLRIPLPTVYYLVQRGQLPAIQIGGRWRIKKSALDKQKFDLIFLDLKLPDGPADDVYDMAKEQQPECPIIIITGYPDSEMLNRILAKGPITVLKKPLKVEQLKDTVRILGHKDAVKLAA